MSCNRGGNTPPLIDNGSPILRSTFLVFGAFAVAFSTLAGLLPAWKAVRLNPSEALRSE